MVELKEGRSLSQAKRLSRTAINKEIKKPERGAYRAKGINS